MSAVARVCVVVMAWAAAAAAVAGEPANAGRPQARQMDQPAERAADPAGRDGAKPPAYLGIVTGPVTEELREHADLPERGGLVITRVEPASPAAKAGLKAKDILLEVDGLEVTSPLDLADMIEAAGPGARVTLDIVRRGKPQEVAVVLGSRRAAAGVDGRPADAAAGGLMPGAAARPGLGMPPTAENLLAQALAMADANVAGGGQGSSIQVQTSTIGGVRESRAVSRDREGTIEIAVRGGRKTVAIFGPDGTEIHEGPLDDAEDFEVVPEAWRDSVRTLDDRVSGTEDRQPVPPGGV